MTSPNGLLRFASCELDLAGRELRRDGTPRALEPRAFDLLATLIEHRDRVVPKHELMQRLWGTAVVTEDALVRAVALARKAIGDGGSQPLIKTVHRVGYRFVGMVLGAVPPNEVAASLTDARLAILPLVNATGEAAFAWLELGLAAMVAQALEANAPFGVIPLPQLLKALAESPAATTTTDKAAVLQRTLGATCIVQGSLLRQGRALWLHFEGHGPHGGGVRGSLRGDEPTQLGLRMAQSIAGSMSPLPHAAVRFESQDPFVNQVYARGIECLNQRQGRSAIKFFEVALELEPGSIRVRLECLRALVQCEDPSAMAFGAALRELAEEADDPRLLAIVHESLGRAHAVSEAPGAIEQRNAHLARAWQLAEPFVPQSWALRIALAHASADEGVGNLEQTLPLFELVEAHARRTGDHDQLCLAMSNRALTEVENGKLLAARSTMDQALELTRRHGTDAMLALVQMRLFEINASLGCLRLALTQAARTERLLPALQKPDDAAQATEMLAALYAQIESVDDIDRLLSQTGGLVQQSGQPVKLGRVVALAIRAWCAGDLVEAEQGFGEAIESARSAGQWRKLARWLPWHLSAALRCGRNDRVKAQLDALADNPGPSKNPSLQAAALHAQAAMLQAEGRREAALTRLQSAIDIVPAGRISAVLRLDAAWLTIEQGESESARRLLREMEAWLDEHPLGIAVFARLLFAEEQWSAAHAAMERYQGQMCTPLRPFQQLLLAAYANAATLGKAGALPNAPALLSLL